MKILEEQVLQTKAELSKAVSQNEKLVTVLKSERERLEALKEEVEKLTRPPATFGTYLRQNEDGSVDVFTGGRKMRVNIDPEIERDRFRPGVEVILNEALNVVEILDQDLQGEVVRVKEVLTDDRMIVVGRGDEERVALMSARVKEEGIRAGDPVLLDGRSGYIPRRIQKKGAGSLVYEPS